MDYNTLNEVYDFYLSDGKNVNLLLKEIENKLLKYNTIRIDFKCYGENNSFEIIENSDLSSEIRNLAWFKRKEGEGFIIESYSGCIDLKIRCSNADKIKIGFRSIPDKDKLKNKFPIYIDFQNIIIDDEVFLNESKLVWNDKPLIFRKDLDSDIVCIHIEWRPFSENSLFINEFKEESDKLKRKNKKLKNENQQLKNKLNEVFESNSWKLTSIFRRK